MYVGIMTAFQDLSNAYQEREKSKYTRFPLYDYLDRKTLLIALALVSTGVFQSLGRMTFREVFSSFDFANLYDMAVRLTWVLIWILSIQLDLTESEKKVSSSRILKLCLKNSWLLFPFVLLSLLSNSLNIENPLYQVLRLDRLD